jgi:prepilin-type N-terminal cleavage/methylation domain-containing protein
MFKSRFCHWGIKSFQGLSLIEVCIAIAILAIVLVSLSGIFNQGYRFLRKARMNHLACLLAQEQMENLTNEYIFTDLNANIDYFNQTEVLSGPFQGFNRTVNVTYWASEGSDPLVREDLAQINVTVSWQGQSGVQNYNLTSLVVNYTHQYDQP